jgi:hypothetical protein
MPESGVSVHLQSAALAPGLLSRVVALIRGHQVYVGLEIQQQGQTSVRKTKISWLACYPYCLDLHVSLAYWSGSVHEDAFKRGQICIIQECGADGLVDGEVILMREINRSLHNVIQRRSGARGGRSERVELCPTLRRQAGHALALLDRAGLLVRADALATPVVVRPTEACRAHARADE